MSGHYLNYQPWALEIKTKEAELRVLEREFELVLCRLEGLEVSDTTRAIFQRYVNGELTIKELRAAIDQYLYLKAK